MSKVANGTIVKIDQEKQLVFGWASVIKDTNDKILLDRQEDFIESEDELEKAAYDYVLKSRDGGEMHIRKGVSTMVESVVLSKEKQLALGIPAGTVPIGWWIGFKVNDDRVWNEVKKGGYVGFSVHGTGKRHSEEIAFEKITEVEKCACEPQVVEKYNPQYWSVMRKAQISIVENAISKGEGPGHPFRGNQWTRGKSGAGVGGSVKGSKKKSKKQGGKKTIKTIEEGIKRVLAGEDVDMPDVAGAHTLIKELAKMAQDAKKRGEKNSIRYDLCKVSVKGTNLFCGGNKGIPRDAMPQAKGEVVKGSKAEKLLAKQNAKRVKNGKKPKDEVDGTEDFLAHLDKAGISASKPKRVRSDKLSATQQDMNGEKVGGMMTAKDYDPSAEPIFVSRDGYVVDGHHRWAATVGKDAQDGKLGNNHKMNVIVLDASISKILKEANAWTDSFGIKRKTVGK
jgi:hypothetical protein